MARAYTTFPNYGLPIHEVSIVKIVSREGEELPTFPEVKNKKVYSEQTAEVMVQMLGKVITNGTAASLRYDYGLYNDLGGKTGTGPSRGTSGARSAGQAAACEAVQAIRSSAALVFTMVSMATPWRAALSQP